MKTYHIIGSIGIKGNRKIARADTGRTIKAKKPTASKLKALGYTASQREAILNAYKEL